MKNIKWLILIFAFQSNGENFVYTFTKKSNTKHDSGRGDEGVVVHSCDIQHYMAWSKDYTEGNGVITVELQTEADAVVADKV